MTHRITIPNWHPTRLNQLVGVHWATKHRRRQNDDAMVRVYAYRLRTPPASGKRRVSLEITLSPRQRVDEDCFWKSTLDALVNCDMLVNDSATWCTLGPVTFTRAKAPATVIVLEDVE